MAIDTFVGRPLDEVPTPALVVDLDRFEANLARMMAFCHDRGVALRPHAKTHKSPDVARRQISAGALGISVATVGEAEAMVAGGLPGVLLTSPIVDAGKIGRMVGLKAAGGDVMLAVGDPIVALRIDAAAAAAGLTLDVLLDLDVGDRRIGIPPGESARALALLIARESRALRLAGVQAYSGLASHVVGHESRAAFSREAVGRAAAFRDRLIREGLELPILSVASTGTYDIDGAIPGVTELQCGSFVFMDQDYERIGAAGGRPTFDDFAPGLSVRATVICAAHDDLVTVDAGIKAFATDVESVPRVIGRPGLAYRRRGDEFGQVTAARPGEPLPSLGEVLTFSVPHCDPTVNLYDRIYAARGDRVEAVWPVAARREFIPAG